MNKFLVFLGFEKKEFLNQENIFSNFKEKFLIQESCNHGMGFSISAIIFLVVTLNVY
jgi:hypothetical protein